jgi:non-specific serine/threonine protein kinase
MAWELLEVFEGGVYIVELASIADSDLVVPTIAVTLGLREAPGTPIFSALKERLREKTMLLVLDNFEQLLPARKVVSELLAECPELKVLMTSREVLRLRAEHRFTVPPLAVPESGRAHSTEAISRYGSVALFVERAQMVKHDFELTEANSTAVADICHRVDGLPLAIELLAARVKLLPPHSIVARLGHPLRLLTRGAADAPARQQTMRDAIEWSYQLLSEEERALFRCLAVFSSGCSLQAGEAVCNRAGDISIGSEDSLAIEVLDNIESLLEKSLVRRVDRGEDDPRLVMLETVRDYALEELEASGEGEELRARHAEWCLMLAEQVEPHLRTPGLEREKWLDRLYLEIDNLRAALGWLLEVGTVQPPQGVKALRLATTLRRFWESRVHLSEGRQWLEKALLCTSRYDPVIEPEVTPLRLKALTAATWLAQRQGDFERIWALGEERLAITRELGDKEGMASALNGLGMVAMSKGDKATARSFYESSLALWREVRNDLSTANVLNNLGELARLERNYDQAERLYQESLALFRTCESRGGIINSLNNLGYSAYHQGDLDRAKVTFLEALALGHEARSKRLIPMSLTGLAGIALTIGSGSGHAAKKPVAEHAVRLLGAVKTLNESVGAKLEPLEQIENDRHTASARAMLGELEFATAWEEGQAMTFDQVIEYARDIFNADYPPNSTSSRRAEKAASGGLTRREREVASLVAEGLSNKRIAERLVLSERTAEMHVAHVLRKLGYTTRAQITAWAIRHGLAPSSPQE